MINLFWDSKVKNEYIICLKDSDVLVNKDQSFYFTTEELEKNNININNKVFIANKNEKNIYAINLENIDIKTTKIRKILSNLENDDITILTRALGVINWLSNNKYCGKCGKKIELKNNEFYLKCDNCKSIIYPKMSPAIIVGITKGNKILLAHNYNFPKNHYSILAGFVEWGESFEDTVKREVFEEVKINVKNIKYFGSQSWPFPSSIMVGFTAEYESGEITPDRIEIEKADWFDKNTLPNLPGHGSISRKIIESLI